MGLGLDAAGQFFASRPPNRCAEPPRERQTLPSLRSPTADDLDDADVEPMCGASSETAASSSRGHRRRRRPIHRSGRKATTRSSRDVSSTSTPAITSATTSGSGCPSSHPKAGRERGHGQEDESHAANEHGQVAAGQRPVRRGASSLQPPHGLRDEPQGGHCAHARPATARMSGGGLAMASRSSPFHPSNVPPTSAATPAIGQANRRRSIMPPPAGPHERALQRSATPGATGRRKRDPPGRRRATRGCRARRDRARARHPSRTAPRATRRASGRCPRGSRRHRRRRS